MTDLYHYEKDNVLILFYRLVDDTQAHQVLVLLIVLILCYLSLKF